MIDCAHNRGTTEVRLAVTDELVAELCKTCGAQLPPGYDCTECDVELAYVRKKLYPVQYLITRPCAAHGG